MEGSYYKACLSLYKSSFFSSHTRYSRNANFNLSEWRAKRVDCSQFILLISECNPFANLIYFEVIQQSLRFYMVRLRCIGENIRVQASIRYKIQ